MAFNSQLQVKRQWLLAAVTVFRGAEKLLPVSAGYLRPAAYKGRPVTS